MRCALKKSFIFIHVLIYVHIVVLLDAYYCKGCVLQEKDRDGCPKIVNMTGAALDNFYDKKKYGFKKR